MKRRGRLLALISFLLAALVLLTGCGGGKTSSDAPQKAAVTAAAAGKTEAAGKTAPEKTKAPVQTNTPTAAPTEAPTEEPEEAGPIIEPQRIADYLFEYGELPDNFLTKQEARDLGWNSGWNYVSDVAPGMSIGGDRFGNYDGNLPWRKGVRYYEADCWYTGGPRGAERIVWSTEGRVWYTDDHYQTFTEMYPSGR